MQFSIAALTAVLATVASAAPTARDVKSMMAADTTWTINSMKRVCDTAKTTCTWSFGINTGSSVTGCGFTVLATSTTPADQVGESGVTCGNFYVTSGWSGQFGPGNGFTVLSVVDQVNRLIIWPGYTDVELASGNVVTPDKSYTPQSI